MLPLYLSYCASNEKSGLNRNEEEPKRHSEFTEPPRKFDGRQHNLSDAIRVPELNPGVKTHKEEKRKIAEIDEYVDYLTQ